MKIAQKYIYLCLAGIIALQFYGSTTHAQNSPRKEVAYESGNAGKSKTNASRLLFRKAEQHFFRRRFHIARRLLLRVLALDPENARAYSYLGDIDLKSGRPAKAADNFRIAAELSKSPSREFFRLGQAFYLQDKAKKALEAYDEAYKLDPTLHICRFQKGVIYLELLRNKKKTIEHWEAFRKAAPADQQGPAIDRALAILKRKGYKLPLRKKNKTAGGKKNCLLPCAGYGQFRPSSHTGKAAKKPLPKGSDSRRPYRKADHAKPKKDNKREGIMDIDDL